MTTKPWQAPQEHYFAHSPPPLPPPHPPHGAPPPPPPGGKHPHQYIYEGLEVVSQQLGEIQAAIEKMRGDSPAATPVR